MKPNQPHTKQIKSEYTMFGLHFKRYNALLEQADLFALAVRPPNIQLNKLADYYNILKQIYINFRPLIDEPNRKKIETFFNNIEEKVMEFSTDNANPKQKVLKVDVKLIKDLEQMHMSLLDIMQIVNLGIPIQVSETLKKKLSRSLLGVRY